MNIQKQTLELIYSLSNSIYCPNERIKTEHMNRIRSILEKEFPDLEESL